MDPTTIHSLIERYKQGYDEVVAALEGATDRELDARPAPEKWTAREIVHHLADSEMTSAIRLRKLLAEDTPTIYGYDQEVFARTLYYDRPIAESLAAFRAARRSTAELLDRMTADQWRRSGVHSESGPYPATKWLQIYADHAHNHAAQIRRARQSAQ
jgi:DinB superfamily